MANFSNIKKDFPIFQNNPDLVYLDSTATSLKPKNVIEALNEYYQEYSANIYRGVYAISEKATEEYEMTRNTIARFINAQSEEVIFTRNTTESLNLIAYALGRMIVEKKDEIATSVSEHHSNFVPWQQLAFENGADFKVIDIDEHGDLLVDPIDQVITKKTKVLALTHISNVLGVVNPIKKITAAAKAVNPDIIVVVDGAQAVPHIPVDVVDLGCDFYAFSSHKMLGPTGVGVLWGKYELLKEMIPFNLGGEMIQEVYLEKTVFKDPPHKFEAGTPDIAGVIALKEAVRYLEQLGLEGIHDHEKTLVKYAAKILKDQFKDDIRMVVPEHDFKSGILAFTFCNYHPHDVAQILDEDNICVRAGHHCAMPLHKKLNLQATVRASFYLYNTKDDVHKLVESLLKVKKILP